MEKTVIVSLFWNNAKKRFATLGFSEICVCSKKDFLGRDSFENRQRVAADRNGIVTCGGGDLGSLRCVCAWL